MEIIEKVIVGLRDAKPPGGSVVQMPSGTRHDLGDMRARSLPDPSKVLGRPSP
jgi:hypothetical protein